VPTLGIVGTADPALKDFERLKAAIPQLTLVQTDGASHGNAPNRPAPRFPSLVLIRPAFCIPEESPHTDY
jgi:pimeloyl-ACP methyl ester carboxylesterase